MKNPTLEIDWNADVSELMDSIAVLVLEDALECIDETLARNHEEYLRGELTGRDFDDYAEDLKVRDALKVVIRYMGPYA